MPGHYLNLLAALFLRWYWNNNCNWLHGCCFSVWLCWRHVAKQRVGSSPCRPDRGHLQSQRRGLLHHVWRQPLAAGTHQLQWQRWHKHFSILKYCNAIHFTVYQISIITIIIIFVFWKLTIPKFPIPTTHFQNRCFKYLLYLCYRKSWAYRYLVSTKISTELKTRLRNFCRLIRPK